MLAFLIMDLLDATGALEDTRNALLSHQHASSIATGSPEFENCGSLSCSIRECRYNSLTSLHVALAYPLHRR